jgi:two-component system, NarL family, response regulator LiaR
MHQQYFQSAPGSTYKHNFMANRTVRILIADDHPQVRRGLSIVLEEFDDFEWVGEAKNGQEAVALVEQLQPDVVLMDLVMPVMDGVSATRIIHQKFPHVQIIALTSSVDPDLIQSILEAGAYTWIFKNITIDALEKTIRAAAA